MTARCVPWKTRLTSVLLLRRGVRQGASLTKTLCVSLVADTIRCRTRSVMWLFADLVGSDERGVTGWI